MSREPAEISTGELLAGLDQDKSSIIDIRAQEGYNGWRLEGEKRGGHVSGARNLPAAWADYIDWIEIVRSKGIEENEDIVIYGYDSGETQRIARRFEKAGFSSVRVYNRFKEEWSRRTDLPMSRLSRYDRLVSAHWLHSLINNGEAPEFDNDRYLVCHAHYRNRGAYDEGHIPGAVELDTNRLESQKTWNRRPPEELEKALEELGVTTDTTVILYGRFSFPDNSDPFPGSSAGHLGAMRCAFIMLYAGVEDVRILNGGLRRWTDAGYQTVTEETPKEPVKDFGARIPDHPEFAVDLPQAREILRSDDQNLVSVRSWREFTGEVSGYNYIEKKGRIPGAVFGNCGSDAYHMENYRNLDHTAREYHEIEKIWAASGITPDKHNSFYCGTGWRASEAFFNAYLMGWPAISVFDGGWFEWSSDESNPYERGVPPGFSE